MREAEAGRDYNGWMERQPVGPTAEGREQGGGETQPRSGQACPETARGVGASRRWLPKGLVDDGETCKAHSKATIGGIGVRRDARHSSCLYSRTDDLRNFGCAQSRKSVVIWCLGRPR